MSVAGLSTTVAYVYGVTNSQDAYGALYETFTLKYANIPVRLRYMQGRESVIDAKIQNIPRYRIYFPKQYNITESDLIIDAIRNRKYDTKYVNKMDRRRHMQIDTLYVDTVLGDFCPNVIHSINASIVTAPQPSFTLDSYQTVELNGTVTKNHFIALYNGSTVGKTSSDKIFFGDTSTETGEYGWQSIIINGSTYYLKVWNGVATSDCVTDLNGTTLIPTP